MRTPAQCTSQRRTRGGAPTSFFSVEALFTVVGEVAADRGEEGVAEFVELLLAHAADAAELGDRAGIIPRHLAQRGAAENDVGGHVALVGELLAQFAQTLEENLAVVEV